MQAGTTGVNTVRIYNPVKQSKDHDPEGNFIKKWVPELRSFPKAFIHEPHLMTELDRKLHNIDSNYPAPIVDITESGRSARIKIWGHRKLKEVKEESKRIINVHTRGGRRNS